MYFINNAKDWNTYFKVWKKFFLSLSALPSMKFITLYPGQGQSFVGYECLKQASFFSLKILKLTF